MQASISGIPDSFSLSGFFKKSLLCTSVMCAMGLAQAQEDDNTGATANENEVVEKKAADNNQGKTEVIEIRGILASAAENLAIKRLSNATMDAITAEDIGKFPDKNVADSLQRVTGVVIRRDGGEGSSVSIRGLSPDLTFSQLNGNFIASSPGEPSRSFSYSLLPSTMIQRVEVYKSSEARLDEGGVGGSIIMHTRKPLDMEKNSGVINFETTYADVTEDFEPQFSGVYSWKNDDEDLGLLLGYTQQERTNRTQTSRVNIINKNFNYGERVDNQLIEGGASGYAPQSMLQDVVEETRKRTGVQLTGQWLVNDAWEVGFNYFRFTLGQDSIRHQLEYPEWNNNDNFWTDVRVDADAEYVTGIDYAVGASGQQASSNIPRINGEYNIEESSSDTFDFFATYEGDDYTVKFVAGHTEAEGGPTEKYRAAYYAGASSLYYGYDLSNQQMTTYMDPDMINNQLAGIGGEPDVGATDSSFITGTQEEDYAQVDVDYLLDYGIVENLHFGVKYRKGKVHRDSRNSFYLDPDFDIAAAEAEGSIDLDDDYSRNGGIPALADVMKSESLGNLSDVINTNLFPAVDWHKYQDYLNENYVHYTRKEDNYVYNIEEEIFSAYIQADYKYKELRGNFGVRVVETTTTSGSSDKFTYRLDWKDAEGNELPIEQQRSEIVAYTEKESTDTQILPSFNIVWDINESWVLRGAAAKVMARPDYADLGADQTLIYTSNEYSADRSAADDYDSIKDSEGWTGQGGNSQLKPFESTQFDLSLEYYYGEGSGAGIALFSKDVDNFVVPMIVDVTRDAPVESFVLENAGNESVTAGGDNLNVRSFSTNANGTNATSRGVEVYIQHFFENGFGFAANYTYNDTNQADVELDGEKVGESPLIGSSDYQMNFSLFYEDDLFSVRASYNERGPTVGAYVSSWETNQYTDTYDQVDVNGSYNFSENLVLSLQVINLTESESYTHLGDDTKNRFISNSYSGRRFYAGVTYRF